MVLRARTLSPSTPTMPVLSWTSPSTLRPLRTSPTCHASTRCVHPDSQARAHTHTCTHLHHITLHGNCCYRLLPVSWEASSSRYARAVPLLHQTKLVETTAHRQMLCVCVCPCLQLYGANCDLKHVIKRADGAITCCAHIPELGQVVVASADLQVAPFVGVAPVTATAAVPLTQLANAQLSFYDDVKLRLHKCFHVPSSQVSQWLAVVRVSPSLAHPSHTAHCTDLHGLVQGDANPLLGRLLWRGVRLGCRADGGKVPHGRP